MSDRFGDLTSRLYRDINKTSVIDLLLVNLYQSTRNSNFHSSRSCLGRKLLDCIVHFFTSVRASKSQVVRLS